MTFIPRHVKRKTNGSARQQFAKTAQPGAGATELGIFFREILAQANLENKMNRDSLKMSMDGMKSVWGPLSTELVAASCGHMEELLRASVAEEWLAELHTEAPASKELYRDPEHGFVLLAHTEPTGLYRPPHDHGRGWVIYALQSGEIEMGTYARSANPDGSVQLVKRGSTLVRPGQVQVYLPGDIHDTRCVAGPALLFRFTERDLKKEDKEAHQLTRYVERDGSWTVPGS